MNTRPQWPITPTGLAHELSGTVGHMRHCLPRINASDDSFNLHRTVLKVRQAAWRS